MDAELRSLIANPTTAELELIASYGALKPDGARDRAFQAFARTGLPHRRMEGWRWSDFKSALNELSANAVTATTPFDSLDGVHTIRFTARGVSGDDRLPAGVRAFRKQEGQAFSAAEDVPVGALTAALANAPSALMIEVTGEVATPLHLRFEGAAEMTFHRVVLVVRPGASIRLIESHIGGASLNGTLIEIGLREGGRVERTLYQDGDRSAVQAVTALIHLDASSHFRQTALVYGAKRARIETRLIHRGPGAEAVLDAAYIANEGYHADLTSHVRHGAEGCTTRQLTRGVARAGGRGIFQGKFHVAKLAQRTDADMQHNAILLEDGAEVNAKPELEIYADDVACAHGNTCGALDEQAVFYLRQRGIPLVEARALLTEAHLAAALENETDAAVHEVLLVALRSRLRGDEA